MYDRKVIGFLDRAEREIEEVQNQLLTSEIIHNDIAYHSHDLLHDETARLSRLKLRTASVLRTSLASEDVLILRSDQILSIHVESLVTTGVRNRAKFNHTGRALKIRRLLSDTVGFTPTRTVRSNGLTSVKCLQIQPSSNRNYLE
ncbi:hypothetical protein PROSTU_00668 [Providencia stuartii ATCC 25827]|uniref:Uncharacterized protein n=1 Tax=Providencia stuartii ATCC 25827 TaxID=471874 RepID=A0AA87CUQ8_PROST|nr:hypothetical protein PROSTU_00668 [Providencia stuartii ATCC 25827]